MVRPHKKDTPVFAIVISCVMGIVILVMVIGLISSAGSAERHAREILNECAAKASRAVTQDIPSGHYEKAVQTAQDIEGCYPLGAELPVSHPFAKEYAMRKDSYVQQIVHALQQATGMGVGRDWDGWRRFIAAWRAGKLPSTGANE